VGNFSWMLYVCGSHFIVLVCMRLCLCQAYIEYKNTMSFMMNINLKSKMLLSFLLHCTFTLALQTLTFFKLS